MLLEIIIAIVVIVAILLFVGIPLESIFNLLVIVLAGGLVVAIALFVIFFLATGISLLFFQRTEGKFLRFNDEQRFERAVYMVREKEYTCLFPAESVARRMIYEKETHKLWIPRSPKGTIAYDAHSMTIIRVGLLSSIVMVVGIAFFVLQFLKIW